MKFSTHFLFGPRQPLALHVAPHRSPITIPQSLSGKQLQPVQEQIMFLTHSPSPVHMFDLHILVHPPGPKNPQSNALKFVVCTADKPETDNAVWKKK